MFFLSPSYAESIRIDGNQVANTIASTPTNQNDTCLLDDIPPALESFRININRIIKILDEETQGVECRKGYGEEAEKDYIIVQATSVRDVLQAMDSTSGDIGSNIVEHSFFYRGNTAVPDYLMIHQRYLEQIHKEILQAGTMIGRRCAPSVKPIEIEADLIGNEEKVSPYTIVGQTPQNILNTMSKDLRLILEFTQSLTIGQYADILDESLLKIAPIGFDEQMRLVYAGTYYDTMNECELLQPETQSILERVRQIHAAGFSNEDAQDVMGQNALSRKYANGMFTQAPSSVDVDYLTVTVKHRDGFSTSEAGQREMIRRADGIEVGLSTYHDYVSIGMRESQNSGQGVNRDRANYLERDVLQFLGVGDESEGNQPEVEISTSFVPIENSNGQQGSRITPIKISDIDEIEKKTIAVVLLQNSLNESYLENDIKHSGPSASEFATMMAPLANAVYYLDVLTDLTYSNKQVACDNMERQAVNVYPSNCGDLENEIRNSLGG